MKLVSVDKVGDKTREGLKWVFVLQFAQKIFFFISTIILARLLTPADFGLSTMAITLDTITWLVLSLGINSAIMYYQDNIEERFNAGFWVYVISATFFFIVEFSVAPLIAHFYKQPMLIPIIRASACGLFIASFSAIQKAILSKNLEYKKISVLETLMNTLLSLLYVSFAFAGFRVWSFIYPKIIIAFLNVICLWNMTKWRPKFKFYFKYWGEMLNYGKNVLFSNVIDYLLNNSTYMLIGSLIGATSLGLYTFGYDKSMMIINNFVYPVIGVAYPAFARLQDYNDRLKNAFFKAMKIISLVAFPYSFFQLAIGPEFITTIYGTKWLPAVLIFQMIVTYSMMRAISVNGSPLLEATGHARTVLRWNIIFSPLYIGSIYLGYKLGGLYGIGFATAFAGILGSFGFLSLTIKLMKWNISDVFTTVSPALYCSIIATASLFAARATMKMLDVPAVIILITLIPLGALIYGLCVRFLFKDTYEFVLENLNRFIGPKIMNIFTRKAEAA